MIIFRKKVAGLTESTLSRFVLRARRAVKLPGQVNVLVTGNHEMAALNRQFRKKGYPTDVLSFPACVNKNFAGDIAISAEIAAQNARALGHSCAEEIKILALHGLLHIAGYDHETDRDEMAKAEKKYRRVLHLHDGLIERSEMQKETSRKNATRKQVGGMKKRRAR